MSTSGDVPDELRAALEEVRMRVRTDNVALGHHDDVVRGGTYLERERVARILAALGSAPPEPMEQTHREAALREVLAFTKAKLEIVLSSHLCRDHGAGECCDLDGALEALRRAAAVLGSAPRGTPEDQA